jgi:predicted anti-sigma-YlaC factor YlaD
MTALDCRAMAEAIEPLAGGEPPSRELQAHLDGCDSCRARLALAVRLERVLAEWPIPAPTPALASRVTAAARQESWRREQVVDWGFNVAIAAGLAAVVVGLAAVAWLLGSAAGPATSSAVVADAVLALLARVRAQFAVMSTATLLLATTLGAWWWAEGRVRWP